MTTTTIIEATDALPSPTIERRLREVLSVDVTADLARVTVPILSLTASHDPLVPHLPLPSTQELGGPHFILQQAPQKFGRRHPPWIASTFIPVKL